jgi:hypothetical protein
MIRIAICAEAFDAIAATLPLGSVGYEAKRNGSAERKPRAGGPSGAGQGTRRHNVHLP